MIIHYKSELKDFKYFLLFISFTIYHNYLMLGLFNVGSNLVKSNGDDVRLLFYLLHIDSVIS